MASNKKDLDTCFCVLYKVIMVHKEHCLGLQVFPSYICKDLTTDISVRTGLRNGFELFPCFEKQSIVVISKSGKKSESGQETFRHFFCLVLSCNTPQFYPMKMMANSSA